MRVVTIHEMGRYAMLFRKIALFAVLALASPAVGAELTVDDKHVFLGDTSITLRVYSKGGGPTFIRVHQNETDAGIVGQRIVAELGGRFTDIVHTGERNITFTMSGHRFSIDPNRIFTKEAVEKAVRPNAKYDVMSIRTQIASFASAVLELVGVRRPLIALHNNRGGLFRLATYQKGGLMYRDGKTFAHEGKTGRHNFVIVTKRELADKFVELGVSVVYQPLAADVNDGSLSYRYGRDGVAYVNVETLFGQRDLQMRLAGEAA